jgi:integrase
MSKRSADGLYKRGAVWWGWRRKFAGGPLSRASTGCRDRAAARLVKAEWERMAADPARYAADKATLGEALSMYMEAQHRADLSRHTVKTYDLHCRQLARVLDQDTPLKAIGRHSFEAHIKQREAEGTHPHTVSRELVRLRAVLVEAKHKGLYPHELVGIRPRYSKHYEPRKRALPMDELMRLGKQLRADRLAHVAFVVATGCRFIESCRARAGHISPEGYVYLDGSKTELAKRTIPIAPPLRPFLEFALRNAPGSQPQSPGLLVGEPSEAAASERRAGPGPGVPTDAVASGGSLFPRWTNSRRDILEACKRAGIAPVTWNDLRRTNATLLAEAGVDGDLGHKLLGHSDDRMWQAVYAKPRPAALAKRLEAVFHGTESAQATPLEARKREEIASAMLGNLGLRSRRSQVRILPGAQPDSNGYVELDESSLSTEAVWFDPLRYINRTVRMLPAVDVTPEEIAADLAPRVAS